jgi:hypothetical protein
VRSSVRSKPKTRHDLAERICKAVRWIMLAEIKGQLGVDHASLHADVRKLKIEGTPVHSVSLIYGWGEVIACAE